MSLPKALLPANEFNAKGYFESEPLVRVHDALLEQLGRTWQSVQPLDEARLHTPLADDYGRRIEDVLGAEYARGDAAWVIKDPRLCTLFPLWRDVLARMDVAPRILIPFRPVADVAASLAHRDGISFAHGMMLWMRHVLDAEKHTRGVPRLFVPVAALIEDWRQCLHRIAGALGVSLHGDDEARAREIEAFLSPELLKGRDHFQSLEPGRADIPGTDELTALLHEISAHEGAFDAQFDRIAAPFNDRAEAVGQVMSGIELSQLKWIRKYYHAAEQLAQATQHHQQNLKGAAELNARYQAALKEEREAVIRASRRLEGEAALEAQLKAAQDSLATRQEENRRLDTARQAAAEELTKARAANRLQHTLLIKAQSAARDMAFEATRAHKRPLNTLARHAGFKILQSALRMGLVPSGTQRKKLERSLAKRDPKRFLRGADQLDAECAQGYSDLSNRPLLMARTGGDAVSDDAVLSPQSERPPAPPVRLIAFYLPQFHPIPENDRWWGRGFTEWTNVSKAQPQFVGHEQPKLPGELGFYDLRLIDVQRRQAELARLYGIAGFCMYFYWFAGKTLLEAPIQQLYENPDIDIEYCLCWANENWSRRWDGLDSEILMAQHHSPEDDEALFAHIAKYLQDPRYIRIEGKPLFVVYRPGLLPQARETAERWRALARANGIGEIFLAFTQSFDSFDPADIGFDAAIEFPPNNIPPTDITGEIERINPSFSGRVYDWRALVERSRPYAPSDDRLFRGVNPSWDNEARRPGRGTVFAHASPAGYREWLENAARDTLERISEPSRRCVFINAWNEWAEGACLEPDRRRGYAYLQATRDALADLGSKREPGAAGQRARRRIVYVSHDAYPHGAQMLSLGIITALKNELGYAVDIVLLGSGPLLPQFAALGTVHDLTGDATGERAAALVKALRAQGHHLAITNTTVSGYFAWVLKGAGFRVVSLVHELPGLIQSYKLEGHARAIAEHADHVVFASAFVQEKFETIAPLRERSCVIRPQGLYAARAPRDPAPVAQIRARLRSRLGLGADTLIVLGVGFADERKGIDLFLDAAEKLLRLRSDAALLWVGALHQHLEPSIRKRVRDAKLEERILFPGRVELSEVGEYYAGADAYALTSREDPFPSVVLEAFDAGLPVAAFDGTTGLGTLIEEGFGALVPAFDTQAMAVALDRLLNERKAGSPRVKAAQVIIDERFSFRRYAFDLAALADPHFRRVSVIVPNYNYAGLLLERLRSIASQTYPIYEVIVLDDASSDGSADWLRANLASLIPEARLVVNASNSGSVFKQWRKGVELASGDVVWIAEADDLSSPHFLSEVMAGAVKEGVVLSYCQSRQMGEDGTILANDYLDYVRDVSPAKWTAPYVVEGLEEIACALSVKNTIPNVSACVFSRSALLSTMRALEDQLPDYKVAGDWLVYVELLKKGRVAFSPEALNDHRRHAGSVTTGTKSDKHLREILGLQAHVRHAVAVSPDLDALADAFARHAYRYLGLASDAVPEIDLNPAYAPLMAGASSGAGSQKRKASPPVAFESLPVAEEHKAKPAVPKKAATTRLPPYTEELLSYVREGAFEQQVPSAIHEQDFIFRFLVENRSFANQRAAAHYYFGDGRRSAERLRELVFKLLPGSRLKEDAFSLLEFASGYGCVTRHFRNVFPSADIVACDIHEEAIGFIEAELAVPARLSRSVPEELNLGRQFDVVFALSFFSHMPLRSWGRWVEALLRHTAPGGYLVFTTQGLTSRRFFGNPEIPENGFWFRAESEQKDLDLAEYGQTIVTPEFVQREVARLAVPLIFQQEAFWWGHQDVYVLGTEMAPSVQVPRQANALT
ncbi:MAG: glycoside hydrolase family 99-like domain-containing protein [Alphaproteobacteria bacterium]|nr:glycoside hydrolase family 99-like domain-containing protein [Alphaproteobacteria bacterium]